MQKQTDNTVNRKKDHIDLCLNQDVSFRKKTSGFDKYEFEHYAVTEIDINKINFNSKFFKKEISFPFLISCMTGGTGKSEKINDKLAILASELNIPIGVGSQRQALESKNFHQSYKIIRQNAKSVPVLGNIGASQIVSMKNLDRIQYLVDLIEADAMVIHMNPLQELIQREGEPHFKGLAKNITKLLKMLSVPIIVKEVGAGISKKAAEKLLDIGVSGIDVAGAGGTSWSAVEILRNNESESNLFWDWGIPTSYCLKEVVKLKKKYKFLLIGSGGISNGQDIAKAIALGADITASAGTILKHIDQNGIVGAKKIINEWFETIKHIMFLTGCKNLKELRKTKLIKRENLY